MAAALVLAANTMSKKGSTTHIRELLV